MIDVHCPRRARQRTLFGNRQNVLQIAPIQFMHFCTLTLRLFTINERQRIV